MRSPRTVLANLALLLCSLAAAWPLTELSTGDAAVLPSVLVIVTVVAVGSLCRRGRLGGLPTLVLQLLVAVTAVALALSARGISPAPGHLRTLSTALGTTIDSASAPLPAKPEVTAMIIAAAALIAVVVDFVGGTSRMSVFAALPVIAPFLLTATALGRVLSIQYFVVAATSWAALLLTQSGGRAAAVDTGTDSPHHPPEGSPGAAARSRWSLPTVLVFGAMTAIAIVLGLLVTPAVPQRPTPALAEGGSQGVDTSVDFSRSLDLSKSLHSTNTAPVLQYSTTAASPGPLRVTTSSRYANGTWAATALDGPFTTPKNLGALPMTGLDPKVPTTSTRTSVTINGMKKPLVAVAAPVEAANFGAGNKGLRIVTSSGVPVLSTPSEAYSLISRDFTTRSRPTSDTAVTPSTPTVTSDDLDTSSLPQEARNRVEAITRGVHGGDGSRFGAAVALQRWFRVDGRFTYSLSLARTQTKNGRALDPLSNFLATKQGYCTQFATAMVMAARTEGIPARIAIGFLPGEESGTPPTGNAGRQFQVHASDAHAWPELYFPGMGWTRFDPTPASRSGAAPAYAPDSATGSATEAPSPSSRPTSSSAPPSTLSTPPPSTQVSSRSSAASSGLPSWLIPVLEIVAGLALVVLLASILPLAGRAERRRVLRAATTDGERDEGHWHAMSWRLADFGLPLARGRSPRATVAAFTGDHPETTDTLRSALSRAARSLEDSRYAGVSSRGTRAATERVITAAEDHASLPARLRAFLAPASGVEFFRRLVSRRRR